MLTRLPPQSQDWQENKEIRLRLAQVFAKQTAGDYEQALVLARVTLQDAYGAEDPGLIASAQERVGELLVDKGEYGEAKGVLESAYFGAQAVGDLRTAFLAANNLVYSIGFRQARFEEGRRWSKHAEVVLGALEDPDRQLEAS